MVLQCDWAQLQVIVLTNDGNGFGFGISGSRNSGAVVRNIFPGGAADRDGALRNGDHLLAVGDVRLWGMGAEQVASILRQAGQDSIRLVVARSVDPSMPQYALNSTIVPTKVLTDPQELDRALQTGIQAVNGFAFDQANSYPEAAYQQTIMDVMPTDMPPVLGFTSAETMVVPPPASLFSTASASTTSITVTSCCTEDNIALPPSTKSMLDLTSSSDTIVTHMSSKSVPQVTIVPASMAETTIQVHTEAAASPFCGGGQRVALVSSQSNPNKISIVPADQLTLGANNDENSINEANRGVVKSKCKTSASCGTLKDFNSISETNHRGHHGEKSSRRKSANLVTMPPSAPPQVSSSIGMSCEEDIKATAADLPEKEEYNIELTKDSNGLGITIAGYVCEKEDLCGIFVKSVIEGSMADRSGCIMVNDQITEVDGASLTGITNQEAVEILKHTGATVKLKIIRYLRGLKFEELQDGIKAANATTPSSPYLASPSDPKLPSALASSSAGANSTSVTVSSMSGPSSRNSSLASVPLLARSSPTSKSLKLNPDSIPKLPRRSVPNVLDDLTSIQKLASADSSATIVPLPLASSNEDQEKERLRLKWEAVMGSKFVIVIAKLRKPDASSGLGISLEGTVDVEDGKEVRPHHYIRSILPGGPIGLDGVLKSGDELLEVNGKSLKGLFHEEVVRSLKELPVDVCLVCARKATGPSPLRGTIVDNVDPGRSELAFASRKILSGSLQSLLASKELELLVKAKSEVSLACTTSQSLSVELSTATLGAANTSNLGTNLMMIPATQQPPTILEHSPADKSPCCSTKMIDRSSSSTFSKKKSQSLDQLSSQAMWKSEVEEVFLVKGEKGLGFSILDYQDPLNPSETVIVVRSLVPGGVAHVEGSLVPGDRIIYVNSVRLEHASLDTAVQALKGAAFGPVKIGISRPISETDSVDGHFMMGQLRERLTSASNEQEFGCGINSTTEEAQSVHGSLSDTICDGSNFSDLKTDCGADDEAEESNESSSESEESTTTVDDRTSALTRGELTPAQNIQILPNLPKFMICIKKGPSDFLGVQLEALAFELSGTVVRQIEADSCVAKDGRLRPGDLILYLNHECLWRVTSSQAKTVLRRAELVSNSIPIVFVPEENLVPSEESTEEDQEDNLSTDSPSESLKLSEIGGGGVRTEEEEEVLFTSSLLEEIQPDLTVQSAKALTSRLLKRFPSDLLESSVDPVLPRDFQEDSAEATSTLNDPTNMVRVYQPPPVANNSAVGSSSSQIPLNGLKASAGAPDTKVWGASRVVEVFRVPGKSLGISIVGGKVDGGSSGIFIKNVIPDSPAGLTGQLLTGDRLIEIGGTVLTSSDQAVAVDAIKNASNPIRFVVQSLQHAGAAAAKESPLTPTKQGTKDQQRLKHELEVLDRLSKLCAVDPFHHLTNRRFSDFVIKADESCHRPTSSAAHLNVQVVVGCRSESHSVAQSSVSSLLSSPANSDNPFQNDKMPIWQQEPDSTKDDSRSNISSPDNNNVGMAQDQAYKYQNLNETPPSPALANHRLMMEEEEDEPGSKVPEIIQHGLSDLERQRMQQKMDAEIVEKRESKLTVLKKSSIDRDDDRMENESTIMAVEEISGNKTKARDLKREESEEEDEEDEGEDAANEDINISENFKSLPGDVIEVDLKRNDYGFGLALAGHSNRNRMGTFVCGIHPQGSAAENGKLQVGDELLKIHKTVVRGRCHLNVSAIMKKIPNEATIKILALRHKNNFDKIAVKKFTQFPTKLDDVIFESPEFEGFLARREIKMQKTTEGLGVMIIEGSHKVLGKGIFVSDIQQNSLAFKANLKVGDMILAVNTESFLDINYEEAALILKQVTGNVRILVVNPKDEEDKRAAPAESTASEASKSAKTPNLLSPEKVPNATAAGSKSPAKSPAKTPAKDAKSPGKSPAKKDDNTIELKKDANGLGISIVGGSDTPLGGVIVHEVYKDGAADKDGRIKPGDYIVSVDGKAFKECTHKDALRALRVTKEKVKIVIDPKHDSEDLYQDMEVELVKKPGKGLGLSVVGRRDGNGVFISDMVVGGAAEANGQLVRGDQIVSVNDQDLSDAKQDQAVALLKTASGSVKIKIRRYKCVASSS